MRISLIGQGPFGAKVLEALLRNGHDILVVYTSQATDKALPLKEASVSKSIPFSQPDNWRAPEVHKQLQSLAPELGVMAFVTDIIPIGILNIPKLGTIQYHPSLLPRHRGASAINWAIIQGETVTGLTIFWPEKGIDTGPILLQKRVEISPDDTVGSLYFNKLLPLGVDAFVEAVEMVAKGTAPRTVQDNSLATYEPPCEEEHALIDWRKLAGEVYNLIRGTNPQPGATTFWNGNKLKIYDSDIIRSETGGKPGELVKITDKGILIACDGSAILVKRVQSGKSPKMAARDFAAQEGLAPGARLGKQ